MTEPPNTEALLATVREDCETISAALSMRPTPFQVEQAVNFLVSTVPRALDAIASELERVRDDSDRFEQAFRAEREHSKKLEAELERVRAERQAWVDRAHAWEEASHRHSRRLDRAVEALREIATHGYVPGTPSDSMHSIARVALAEIEESPQVDAEREGEAGSHAPDEPSDGFDLRGGRLP